MKELIKLKTTESGKKTVSAKELYLGLGLNKKNWSRWYPTNITGNEFFNEGYDYIGVPHYEEGNETMDFAISIEFAKHIAMMARTEKSHQYRNYFLVCEEKAKNNVPKLSKELQAIFMLDEKQQVLEDKVNNLENNMTIDHGQAVNIKHAVDLAVKRLCYGSEAPAYNSRELKRKVYQYAWRNFKDYFNITAYHNLLRKDMEIALGYIQNLILQGSLLREVQATNNQMSF